MNIRYSGNLYTDQKFPMTPSHWNFLQGWLTCFASLNPHLRNNPVTVVCDGPRSMEIHIQGTDFVHYETMIQPTPIIVARPDSIESVVEKSKAEVAEEWFGGEA